MSHRLLFRAPFLAALLLAGGAHAEGPDLRAGRLVDLTHAFDASTLYWPTSPSRFELESLARGPTPGGWFYAANRFRSPEHGGTHLDAPLHFAEEGASVEEIPLERLVAPAVVIDVREAAAEAPEFVLGRADVEAFEGAHGRVPAGSVVLLRTGWADRWPDARRYLGDDTAGDASKLRFPSFGAEAAQLLVVERGVAGLGLDTASIDVGSSSDFPVHRLAAHHGVYGLENLADLGALPAQGAWLIALPTKISGGSGAPARVLAVLPGP